MAFADGSTVRAAIVPETTWGVMPATPAFKTLRRTGGGLRTSKSTQMSNEIRADRNVTSLMHLGQDVTGSLDFEMTYGGAMDDLLAAVLYSAWATDVLKNGVTDHSFTVEETVATGSGDESYSRFTGCMLNTMSLNIQARQPITGSFTFMGRKEDLDDTPLIGATYAAASTTPVSTASANVESLMLGGAFAAPKVRRLTLNITNNLRPREVVGDLYSQKFGKGRFEVTGEAEIYFETNDAYQAALDHQGGALSFNVGNSTGNKYAIAVPKYVFGDVQRNNGSNTSDVMATLPFTGLLNLADACTLKFTRGVA